MNNDFESRYLLEPIEIFDELPGKRGCSDELLDEIEQTFNCVLPPIYRRLLKSDAERIANIPALIHPSRLVEYRQDADEILADEQDEYTFRLSQNSLVIGWEDIYGFYFVDAIGSDSSPVYLFNYYDDSDNGQPRVDSESVVYFLSKQFRQYLGLPIW